MATLQGKLLSPVPVPGQNEAVLLDRFGLDTNEILKRFFSYDDAVSHISIFSDNQVATNAS